MKKKRKLKYYILLALLVLLGFLFVAAKAGEGRYIFQKVEKLASVATQSSSSTEIKPALEKQVTFVVAGDAMFDRGVDYNFREDKIFSIFDNFDKTIFQKADLAVLNLEGPISAVPISADPGGTMSFNMPPKTTDVLVDLGIDAVSLANNHTDNNGKKGYENTVKVLNAVNIKTFGKQEIFDQTAVTRLDAKDFKISAISIDVLAVNADIRDTIKAEKKRGAFVFVLPHWGVEYEKIHHSSQEYLAHKWIDAGADFIIGGHPHVVQDAEVYKGKPIFYSLGNFIFDQKWSAETQQGLILRCVLKVKQLTIEPLPIISENIKPRLKNATEKEKVIAGFRDNLKQAGNIFTFNLNEE